ncbi:MAG TPA: hypothetical protein VMW27_11785 [Thermoanaerobaculia bacterium]|nr:hypothetical protein [Thermoanaerobaculia bacterium]
MLGELSPQETRRILAHLLPGCERCRESMTSLTGAMLFFPGKAAEEAGEEVGAEYDFPMFKALAAARRYEATLNRKKPEAKRPEVPALHEVPVSDSSLSDVLALRDRDWARCEALIERCRALRHRDPEAMVMVAALATTLAERLRPEPYEVQMLADLQARAWAELGNARRVANDPNGSEADISRALERAGHGTGDPLLLARLMDLTASLYTAQRRFAEAFQLLDMAYLLYQGGGERHYAGRALIKKGIATGHALDPEQAVQLLGQGLSLIDGGEDPKLVLAAVHNLIWFFVECGRLEEASRLLVKSRDLYTAHAERLDELKVRWVEGRIAAGFEFQEEAEKAFLEVRAGFAEIDLPYDAALVSLDLAVIWLDRGWTSQIRGLIDETLAIFRARGIRREAIGALLMLREAFEKDRATVALLRNVASKLQRMEQDPALRSHAESQI